KTNNLMSKSKQTNHQPPALRRRARSLALKPLDFDRRFIDVLIVCCRCISPTVREGSVAIRAGALPHGRASAPLVPWQHNLGTLPTAPGTDLISKLYGKLTPEE